MSTVGFSSFLIPILSMPCLCCLWTRPASPERTKRPEEVTNHNSREAWLVTRLGAPEVLFIIIKTLKHFADSEMGIPKLHEVLKPATRSVNISNRIFKNSSFAVDASIYLHRGARSCAAELVQGTTTKEYVDVVMKYVDLLTKYGHVILVFDGKPLESKVRKHFKDRDHLSMYSC